MALLLLLACSDSTMAPNRTPPDGTIALDKVGGDRQAGTVAVQLAQPLIVEVTDAAKQAQANVLVNFVPLSGEVWAGSALTDASGRASDYWTLGTTAGEQRLEVRATNAAGDRIVYDTFFAEAAPDVPADFALATLDTTLFEGEKFGIGPTVQAWDRHGNAVTDFTLTLEAAPPFKVSADTVWAEDEVKGFITLRSGSVDTTIYVGVVHDLSAYTWTGEFSCYDWPTAMRLGTAGRQ